MRQVLAGVAVLSVAGSASAQLDFTFDEGMFAGMSNRSDTFADYATPGGPDLAITSQTQLGDFIYTPIGSTAGLGELEIRAAGASEPAEDNSLFAFLDGDPDNFSFSIEAAEGPFNAFGALLNSAASLGGTTVTLDNGEMFDIEDFNNNGLDGTGSGFLGFSSDTQFNTITFSVTDTSSFEGAFFETIYADVVPTPGGAALLGLGGLLAARRRR